MALRIFGVAVGLLLATYATLRYRRGQLRRGELLLAVLVSGALALAGLTPSVLDPILGALGFHPGDERRIVGLLVLSNVLCLALLFRGFARDDQLSAEVGELVDRLALQRFRDEGIPDISGGCAVILPAFDEATTLPAVLAELPRIVAGLPVVPIVITDGCTDDTEVVARRGGAAIIRRDLRRGSGAAVRLGYEAALAARARVAVTIDADGQHDPREMEALVQPLLDGRADMVQGSRVMGSFEVESKVRQHGVKLFAKVVTLLSGFPVSDPSTGYRAITAAALRRLDLRQEQFYVSELILDAARKGLRVMEVPITLRRRAAGATKKPPPLRYAWGFSKALVRTWLR